MSSMQLLITYGQRRTHSMSVMLYYINQYPLESFARAQGFGLSLTEKNPVKLELFH